MTLSLITAPPAIAVYEAEIPGNAGAIARLCAATGAPLHFIGRLGFSFRHPSARRAGMDYWELVDVRRHVSFADFLEASPARQVWAFTTRATRGLWEVKFRADDVLLFGPESRGLPDDVLNQDRVTGVRIPMVDGARSLNLGSSVSVALYEALRQLQSGSAADPSTTA